MDLSKYIKDQNTLSPVAQPTTDPSSSLRAVASIGKDVQGGIKALESLQARAVQEDDTIKAMKMYDKYRKAQTDFSNRAIEEGAGKILKEQESFHNTFMAEAEAAGLSKKANEWLVSSVLKHGQEVYANTTLLGVEQRNQEKANAFTQFVSSAAQDMAAPGADIPAILDNVRAGASSLYTDPSQAGKVSQAATDTLIGTFYDEIGQDYQRKDQLDAMYKSGYLLDQASPAAQAAIKNKQEKWRDLNKEKSREMRSLRHDETIAAVTDLIERGKLDTADQYLDSIALIDPTRGYSLLENEKSSPKDEDLLSQSLFDSLKRRVAFERKGGDGGKPTVDAEITFLRRIEEAKSLELEADRREALFNLREEMGKAHAGGVIKKDSYRRLNNVLKTPNKLAPDQKARLQDALKSLDGYAPDIPSKEKPSYLSAEEKTRVVKMMYDEIESGGDPMKVVTAMDKMVAENALKKYSARTDMEAKGVSKDVLQAEDVLRQERTARRAESSTAKLAANKAAITSLSRYSRDEIAAAQKEMLSQGEDYNNPVAVLDYMRMK